MPLKAEDIEATRNRLSDHLSSYTVYDLIPDSGKVRMPSFILMSVCIYLHFCHLTILNSDSDSSLTFSKVFALDATVSVEDAFLVMHEEVQLVIFSCSQV